MGAAANAPLRGQALAARCCVIFRTSQVEAKRCCHSPWSYHSSMRKTLSAGNLRVFVAVLLAAVEKRGFPAVKGVGSGSPKAQPLFLVLSCGRSLWLWFPVTHHGSP